jgi:hypothetical protein
MKPCGYCGTENASAARHWSGCGEPLRTQEIDEARISFSQWFHAPFPKRGRLALWLAAWGIVALATLTIKPSYILAAPFFPLGLLALLHGPEEAIVAWMLGLPALLGWGIYVTLSAAIFRTQRKGTFWILYLFFCTLLLLNVSGCQRAMRGASEIR